MQYGCYYTKRRRRRRQRLGPSLAWLAVARLDGRPFSPCLLCTIAVLPLPTQQQNKNTTLTHTHTRRPKEGEGKAPSFVSKGLKRLYQTHSPSPMAAQEVPGRQRPLAPCQPYLQPHHDQATPQHYLGNGVQSHQVLNPGGHSHTVYAHSELQRDHCESGDDISVCYQIHEEIPRIA